MNSLAFWQKAAFWCPIPFAIQWDRVVGLNEPDNRWHWVQQDLTGPVWNDAPASKFRFQRMKTAAKQRRCGQQVGKMDMLNDKRDKI